jgi:hypothetical protein
MLDERESFQSQDKLTENSMIAFTAKVSQLLEVYSLSSSMAGSEGLPPIVIDEHTAAGKPDAQIQPKRPAEPNPNGNATPENRAYLKPSNPEDNSRGMRNSLPPEGGRVQKPSEKIKSG